MARAPRSSRSRITRLSLTSVLDQARTQGFEEHFIDFLELTLKNFAGDFADATRSIALRMGARSTGHLTESIYPRSIVFDKSGDAKAGIAMALYGYYVNAGVGRGVTVTERQTGTALTSSRSVRGITQRSPKPFIDESVGIHHARLSQLLATEAADFLSSLLASSLHQKVRIEL